MAPTTSSVVHYQLDQRGVALQRCVRILPDGLEETGDQRATTDVIVGGCFGTEPVGVQRPADRVAKLGCGGHLEGLGGDMALAVQPRLRRFAVVVRPRQRHEFDVRIGFQILDQGRAAPDERLLQFQRRPVTDHSVVVGQRILDGVVGAGAHQHGIAGKPDAAPAGVRGGATEFPGRLDQ